MRLNMLMVPVLFALAGSVPAQNESVRGEVILSDTDDLFYLRHTGWTLAFESRVIPDNWIGRPLSLQITNFGTATEPQLKVTSAKLTDQVFKLGKMVAGHEADGCVAAASGSFVSVCFEEPGHMAWTLMPGVGVWMLEQTLCGLAEGFADDTGLFAFSFQVPDIDALRGRAYVAQAMVFDFEQAVDRRQRPASPVWFSNLDGGIVLTVE